MAYITFEQKAVLQYISVSAPKYSSQHRNIQFETAVSNEKVNYNSFILCIIKAAIAAAAATLSESENESENELSFEIIQCDL